MNAAPSILGSLREDKIPPAVPIKQWRSIFETGKTQNPPVAAISAAAFLYLAWSVRPGAQLFRASSPRCHLLYSTAAVLTVSIVPFTIAVMSKTNNALLAKAAGERPGSSEATSSEVQTLIEKWITLNGIRSLLPLAGGLVGMLAIFS